MKRCFSFLAVPSCPIHPYLSFASLTVNGTELTYTCHLGYLFMDGVAMKTVNCTEAPDMIGRPPYRCRSELRSCFNLYSLLSW